MASVYPYNIHPLTFFLNFDETCYVSKCFYLPTSELNPILCGITLNVKVAKKGLFMLLLLGYWSSTTNLNKDYVSTLHRYVFIAQHHPFSLMSPFFSHEVHSKLAEMAISCDIFWSHYVTILYSSYQATLLTWKRIIFQT